MVSFTEARKAFSIFVLKCTFTKVRSTGSIVHYYGRDYFRPLRHQ